MREYLNIVQDVLDNGVLKPNRTGIDTVTGFSYNFRHDLSKGFPILTTKKMDGPLWHSVVTELLWFLSGENHIRNFREKSKIWDAWADENGDLETSYGFYWRNFPHAWKGEMRSREWAASSDRLIHIDRYATDECGHFDQVAWIIEQLKTNPNSRRLVCSAWEPYNAHKSKLPPCHFAWVVNVQDGKLNLQWVQRSCDLFLGVPFNIASYALLCHIIAHEVGLPVGTLAGLFIDTHVYQVGEDDTSEFSGHPKIEYDHTRLLKEQLKRDPYPLPHIKIANKSMNDLQFEDFELIGYKSHPRLKARVAI